jgi:macrolide-specific efflux system membrane fusion protein
MTARFRRFRGRRAASACPVAPALLVVALLTSCSALPDDEKEGLRELPSIPLRSRAVTYEVERIDLAVEVRGTAVVTPTREVELYFREPGRLTELNVGVRDEVREGQVLARLESSDLEQELRLAEIDLEIARLRHEALTAGSVTRTERVINQLELSKQEIRTDYLRDRVDAYVIRSPYDGVVKTVRGKVGELVQEYKTMIQVSDPTELELQMRVNVDEFERVIPGQPVLVEVNRGSWAPGAVVAVSSRNQATDPTLRRDEYIAHLALEDSSIELRAQARLTARVIVESRPQTLVIPAAGLREFRERTYVRVLEGELRREVDVRVGVRTDTQVEILTGLEPGQLVIGK